jgi:Subtilase family
MSQMAMPSGGSRVEQVQYATPSHLPPPQRAVRQGVGELEPVDFSTLVAPGEVLQRILELWQRLIALPGLQLLPPPSILPLSPAALPYAAGALRVAVLRHRPGAAPAVVARLRAQCDRFGVGGVLIEEGYLLEPAVQRETTNPPPPGTTTRWSVRFSPDHLTKLRRPLQVELPSQLVGAAFVRARTGTIRLALIDTGDEGAVTQIRCDEHESGPEPPSDRTGHGTTVGALIRLVAPDAEVHSFRVLRSGEDRVESSNLLEAINETTMMYDQFKVVVIPQRALISVAKLGKRDSIHRIIAHNAKAGRPMPVIVCAAGNTKRKPKEPMSYPATVPGFVVAVGLDWAGGIADYNCTVPSGTAVYTVGAFGGVENMPLGTVGKPGRPPNDFFGSSYASALVAAALVS